jgi:hypothetical protein
VAGPDYTDRKAASRGLLSRREHTAAFSTRTCAHTAPSVAWVSARAGACWQVSHLCERDLPQAHAVTRHTRQVVGHAVLEEQLVGRSGCTCQEPLPQSGVWVGERKPRLLAA